MRLRKYADSSYSSMQKTVGFAVIVIGVTLIGLMFLTCVDVFRRYVFSNPLPATAEIAEMILPYIIFVSMAYALITKRHVRVGLFMDRTSLKFQSNFEYPMLILELLLVAWLFYAGLGYFWESFTINEIMMSTIDLPWWVGKFALPLGMFLFVLALMSQILYKIFHKDTVISKSESGADAEW